MPDIYCPKCGEPWDSDELHDVPSMNPDRGAGVLTYEQAAKLFPAYGCGLWIDRFDGGAFTPCTAPVVDPVLEPPCCWLRCKSRTTSSTRCSDDSSPCNRASTARDASSGSSCCLPAHAARRVSSAVRGCTYIAAVANGTQNRSILNPFILLLPYSTISKSDKKL